MVGRFGSEAESQISKGATTKGSAHKIFTIPAYCETWTAPENTTKKYHGCNRTHSCKQFMPAVYKLSLATLFQDLAVVQHAPMIWGSRQEMRITHVTTFEIIEFKVYQWLLLLSKSGHFWMVEFHLPDPSKWISHHLTCSHLQLKTSRIVGYLPVTSKASNDKWDRIEWDIKGSC